MSHIGLQYLNHSISSILSTGNFSASGCSFSRSSKKALAACASPFKAFFASAIRIFNETASGLFIVKPLYRLAVVECSPKFCQRGFHIFAISCGRGWVELPLVRATVY